MNAHTPFLRDHTAEFDALSDLEPLLGRAADLANAAAIVVEHEMGSGQPAETLAALIQIISETLMRAEVIRERGFTGGYVRAHR